MKQTTLLSVFLFYVLGLYAQSPNAPLNKDYYHIADRYEIKKNNLLPGFHSIIKPYQRQAIAELVDSLPLNALAIQDSFNLNYLLNDNWEYSQSEAYKNPRPVLKVFYRSKSDLYHVHTKNFDLHVNPVIYLGGGLEAGTDIIPFINTRGITIRGMIAKRIGFHSYLSDNQAIFPGYVRNWVSEKRVIPHEGFWKQFKSNGYDFFTARGYISFDLIKKHLNLQFGHDRFFIGDGYRSLILSDFSPAYLFLKLNTKVWRINYTNLFTQMYADAFGNASGSLAGKPYPKKYVSLHHLSINVSKNVNIGFFEAVAFGRADSLGQQGLNLNYLNPLIFYRAVEQQGGSTDNVIIGADFKWNFARHFSLYGQWVLDEFLLKEVTAGNGWWGNKYAFQLGGKYIDVAGIKTLDLQVEGNISRPYTYTHEDLFRNYANYRQTLAHPLGANFRELLAILRYQPVKKLNLTGKIILANYGADTLGSNWGADILLPYTTREQEYGNRIGQGINTNMLYIDLTASYQLFHNFFIDLAQIYRNTKNEINHTDTYFISLAIRWNVPKRLHEF